MKPRLFNRPWHRLTQAQKRALLLALLPAAALAQATPEQQMSTALADWVASQYALAPERVTIGPLDPRVPVQPCAEPFRFDYPFVSRDSVRVRCTKPGWQMFVKVGFTASPEAPPPAAPAPSSSPQRQAASTSPEFRQVVVAAVNLMPGQVLQPELLKMAPLSSDRMNRSYLIDVRGLDGQEVLRPIRAGDPLRMSDLRPALLVKKGEAVSMRIGSPDSFQVTVRLEAMQDGRLGEQVKMRNPESGRTLTGIVTGKGTVRGG